MDKNNALVVFQDKKIRRTWHSDEWYFSVVDVVSALEASTIPKRYWSDLKAKLSIEGFEPYDKIVQLKLMAEDGKSRETDCANTKNIFRIIQSVPSPKAEPFKQWLAQVGYERVQEIENPELAQNRMKDIYRAKGYSEDWIEKRVRGIAIRDELTDEWKKRGVQEEKEFAILTAEISKATFGMTPTEYRDLKGLKRENLRDHMNDLEIFMQPIYALERPMRVAVLFSGGASAALSMLQDPNHGKLYTLAGAATHNPMASGISRLSPHMVVLTYPSEKEYYERNYLDPRKQSSKYKYWDRVMNLLEAFEPDALALSGLFQIVRYPVISETDNIGQRREGQYADRTLNVHPADLSIVSNGTELIRAENMSTTDLRNLCPHERKFKGDNAVYDALKAGEQRTQSTVHMATRQIDEGPIVVRSPYVDAAGIEPDQYQKLQDFMKTHCDGPAFQKAMALMASGSLAIENSALFLKENNAWQQLTYGGYLMDGTLDPRL